MCFSNKSQTRLAWEDLKEGLVRWRVWYMLAYQDIKLRYRRSFLGPFWLTISMAITVYSMGYLYSYLFHMNIHDYFPYLVAGMLGWSLVSTTITDLIEAFSYPEAMLKQIKLPYSIYVHRVVTRNIIIFFHNILIMAPILIIFHQVAKLNACFLLLFPGLLIIYFNALCYGLVFSMIGARYRDISQIIKSLVQVAFFITPIMWTPEILPPSKRFIAYLNPFYSFIELVRQPLIGHTPTTLNIIVVAVITIIGIVASYFVFPARRSRIIYWL
ncbi:MAG: hypothetical protein A3E84_05775 [Gammaproteobacteria bacterium RIFCSPHIGHO2_12_FULL_42_13]|nr:MAG: hypothetical protein A3E84_05775 [Gammaproteobacteria bacterium RIFCSPHIGHO2_12_FULL_42_13]